MTLMPEIERRRSIQRFTGEPMDRQALDRILQAGRRAPSAKNRQPWRYIAVQDLETKRKLQNAAYGVEGVSQASAVILACTTNIDYRMPNGQLSYPIDLTFGVSFMMLQAVHEGYGTCLNSTYDEREVKELLSVPYSMRVVLLLLVGRAAEEPEESPRKGFDRVVSYEHW